MNYAIFLGKKILGLALHRLPLNISSLFGDLVCALCLGCFDNSCVDDLCSIAICANLAYHLGCFFASLYSICIFVKNDNLAGMIVGLLCGHLGICRNFLDLILGMLFSDYLGLFAFLDFVSTGLFCRCCSYNLLTVLIGCYCVLNLGSTLDLLCLGRIYGECIATLCDLFLGLSLESLRRVGLFCNCVCALFLGSLCHDLIVYYGYNLFTAVKHLFCRLGYGCGYGSGCNILFNYYAAIISCLCRSRRSHLFSDDIALRLLGLDHLGFGFYDCRSSHCHLGL